jgi:hypothetical protein
MNSRINKSKFIIHWSLDTRGLIDVAIMPYWLYVAWMMIVAASGMPQSNSQNLKSHRLCIFHTQNLLTDILKTASRKSAKKKIRKKRYGDPAVKGIEYGMWTGLRIAMGYGDFASRSGGMEYPVGGVDNVTTMLH